ncbi:unnamed protein product [Choristocarpus tenellus]
MSLPKSSMTVSKLLSRAGLEKRARNDGAGSKLGRRKIESSDHIDSKIDELERELQHFSDTSGIDSDSGGSEKSSEEDIHSKFLPTLSKERIEPLPSHLLPAKGCGIRKDTKRKKPKRLKSEKPSQSGLEGAVKELLSNYEARSSERVPFYCRVCKFEGSSLEDLEAHKLEPLHQEATRKERKVSTCSLCKKQFTSPPQLKEHIAGRAHRETLLGVRSRQGKQWTREGPGDMDRRGIGMHGFRQGRNSFRERGQGH